MTDLTEQWKKGELPEGVYYCDTGNTVETLFTWGKNYRQLTNNKDEVYIPEMDDCEVLSAVPSYEELMEKTKSLKVLAEAYCKEKQKNTKLKELLKEIRSKIKTVYDMDYREFITSAVFDDAFVKKIDEVLK